MTDYELLNSLHSKILKSDLAEMTTEDEMMAFLRAKNYIGMLEMFDTKKDENTDKEDAEYTEWHEDVARMIGSALEKVMR